MCSHLLDLKTLLAISTLSTSASLGLASSLLHWSCRSRRSICHIDVRHGDLCVMFVGKAEMARCGGVDVGREMDFEACVRRDIEVSKSRIDSEFFGMTEIRWY